MSKGFRQLDPGVYVVDQGGTTIGWVYAEGTAGSMVVEHWVLLDGFSSPSQTQSMDVLESSDTYSSLTAFMNKMQQHIDGSGQDGQYVKATCDYDTFPVST